MHIYRTIPTAYGHRLAAEPQPLRCPSTTDRAAFARHLDRQADLALSRGDVRVADLLAWRAAGLREASL